MRIGYPCLNWGIGCKGDRTFRLTSYSERRLVETVQGNLECLGAMLRYNVAHSLLFFRITSDLVPFASHEVCRYDWRGAFAGVFAELGSYARTHRVRLSMHPDQFVLLNSPSEDVTARSIAELRYHAEVLDAMGMGPDAKIQIHVGGAYGHKASSIERFLCRYEALDEGIRRRLVIENDDRVFSVADCVGIGSLAGIPVVFDWLHHRIHPSGQGLAEELERVVATWGPEDGPPIVDYSSQRPGGRPGSHAETVDLEDFAAFLAGSRPFDFDLMLEIKDKEASALRVLPVVRQDPRFVPSSRTAGEALASS